LVSQIIYNLKTIYSHQWPRKYWTGFYDVEIFVWPECL